MSAPAKSWLAIAALLGMAACRDAPSGPASASASSAANNALPPEPPRPASPAELAVIAPAAPGGKLLDFDIREVRGVQRGVMEVHCEKGAARVVLSIALAAPGGPAPPAEAGRYGVFYSLRGASPEDGERLAKALAELLGKNSAAKVPEGMGPFVPRPVSL
jgi:hypothetical protein